MNNISSLTLTKRVEWVMGHRIQNHPLDQHLHGHRFTLEAEFILKVHVDISAVKKLLIESIAEPLDHAFVFEGTDILMKEFFITNHTLKHIETSESPTMEHMLIWILSQLQKNLWCIQNLKVQRLTLWESPTSSATLHVKNRTKKIRSVV